MKILKWILIIALAIIAIPLIGALFTRNEYTVSREVIVNKPKQQVFDYVKLLKNQDNYNKWVMVDLNSKRDYRGDDGTKGFVMAWDSQKDEAGAGEQEIKDIVDGQKIEQELRFKRPFEGVANAVIRTEDATEGQTKVTWTFAGKMDYPMNFIMAIVDIESNLGTQLDGSLANLKTVLEKQ